MRLRVRPTKKQSRQEIILRIIKEQQVKTQDDLKKALTKCGFDVTQSSLSRDITELGLTKQRGFYIVPARAIQGPTPTITLFESAGTNLMVIKTLVGMAAPVGIAIDSHKIPNVIGTIAGDDTVFIATSVSASHEVIKLAVQKLFNK